MRETDYTIEVGSAFKPNIETERDNAFQVFDRLAQITINKGDDEGTARLMYNFQKGLNVSEADMVILQPPPPPPEEQQPPREADTAESVEGQEQEKLRGESAKADEAESKAEEAANKAAAEGLQSVTTAAEPGEVTQIVNGQPVRA